jgi:hypothetical protein
MRACGASRCSGIHFYQGRLDANTLRRMERTMKLEDDPNGFVIGLDD